MASKKTQKRGKGAADDKLSKKGAKKAAKQAAKEARKAAKAASAEAKKAAKKTKKVAKKAAKRAKDKAAKKARKTKDVAKTAAEKVPKDGGSAKPAAVRSVPAKRAASSDTPSDDWTVVALRSRAKELGLAGYSRMTKADLLKSLRA